MATEAPPPKRSVLRRLGKIVDSSLTFFFAGIARVVSNHPYTTLLLALLAGFIMAGGIARIEVVNTAEDLYTPQGTNGFKDRVSLPPPRVLGLPRVSLGFKGYFPRFLIF